MSWWISSVLTSGGNASESHDGRNQVTGVLNELRDSAARSVALERVETVKDEHSEIYALLQGRCAMVVSL